ncbi:MAG: PAS domain S-box protein, partial [Anaerolineae bacterium]|nr:PAS domain S-box protein [Anaerolineae bacterium]
MIKSLQTWLVEPIATIERAEDRRHARLLSALLLVVILAVMSERIFGGNIPVWILFGLFLAYGLNRYSYYPAVAMGCIFTLCVPSFLVAARMVDPNTRQLILVFMWLIVPMLLSSAFFSARVTAVIVSLCLVGMMALPLLNPLITLSILWASIGFVATSGIILLIVIRQRDLSEAERQAELEANNHALLFEVAAHKQTESALRESEEKSRQFQQKLIALQEVNIELGQIDSFDDLCRQAVLLGRSHLGFDRLGLWFRDEADPQYMVGSFGIDEQGNLRDERTLRQPAEPKNVFDITNPTDFPTKAWHKRVLYDNNHEVVGEGWSVIALLARTNQVIGIISVDNLVEKRPFSSEMLELLRLYASTLSHLIVRKQEEIKAHQRRIMLEKVVELGKQVTQVADLNECLLRIYKSVKDDLDFDRVGLFLYDQATGLLHGTYGTDREGNLVEEWDMVLAADQITPNGKPLFLSERIILVSDYQEAYGFRTEEVEKNMAGVKHHVHVVSWAGDQPVATISADNLVSQRPITEEHAEALHLFAGYAGLAIENARLLSKVQEAEQRYRSIFENAIIGIFQIARDGHVLSANPAMAHMLGYQSAQQLIDSITDFDTLIYTNADQRHAIQAYLEARQPIENYEIEVKRRDGSHAWLSQNVQIVFDDDGTPLYFEGTAQDVTDRKQIEEEREKLIQELEKRNEELERFTYTVS